MNAPVSPDSVIEQREQVASATEKLARTDIPAFDPQTTYAQLLRLSDASSSHQEFLLQLLQHAVSVSRAEGAIYFLRDSRGELSLGPRLLSRELIHQVPSALDQITSLARECHHKGYSICGNLDANNTVHAVLTPVSLEDGAREILCIIYGTRSGNEERWNLFTQLLAGYVNLWQQSSINRQLTSEASYTAGLIEAISTLGGAQNREQAFISLTAQLRALFGASRVALGIRHRRGTDFELVQLSDNDEIDKRGAFSRLLTDCFREADSFGQVVQWPQSGVEWERNLFAAHRQFSTDVDANAMLSVPLSKREGEEAIGVLSFWWCNGVPDIDTKQRLMASAVPIGSALDSIIRGREGRMGKLGGGSKTSLSKVLILLLLGSLAAAMFIPVPHRITNDVVIKPVAQRIVSSPFDAVLSEVHVTPGDIVEKGDLLASFDGREMRLQLNSLAAELEIARKEKNLKLAERNTQGAQLARLDMERIAQQIELIETRVESLEVRAPIGGVVINGELEQRQGSLLSKGKALFEIASLNEVNAEVLIAASDYRHITGTHEVDISLEAMPERSWTSTLSTVQPRAVIVDSDTVFLSRIVLDNPQLLIRPGMRGEASIVKPERALGWVLFHKAYDSISMWIHARFGWSVQ